MLVAVFGDAHAHAEALDAVVVAAERAGVDQLWSLGDMIGRGPDPQHVVTRTRERCAVALVGNHDYGATGSVDPLLFGEPGSAAVRSIELAARRLTGADIDWLRARKPAARRDGVQCWHASPRNAVHEYVGAANAAACLTVQRAQLGLVAHTHQAAAWQQTPTGASRARIVPGEPLDISTGRWLLTPARSARRHHRGCAGGTRWTSRPPTGRFGCCSTSREVSRPGAAHPTIRAPARSRARALGLDDSHQPASSDARHQHERRDIA